MFIEPLLVRLAENLKGIDLFGQKVALRAFVDGLTVFASSDHDITRSCEIFDDFCNWTRAKLNKTKSKVLGLGDWSWEAQNGENSEKKPVKSWPVPWLEPVPHLRLLGINFSANVKETTDREWIEMLSKIKGVCESNKSRRFSLYGKVVFLKSFALFLFILPIYSHVPIKLLMMSVKPYPCLFGQLAARSPRLDPHEDPLFKVDSGSRIPNCSTNPCSLTRCIKCSSDPRVRRGRRSDTGWLFRYVSRSLAGTMAPHSPMKTFRFTRKTPSQTRSLSAL